MRLITAAALLGALAVGATACGAPEPESNAQAPTTSLADAVNSVGGDAPAGTTNRAAVALTPEEDYFLRQAQELEQQRCMRAAGWEHHLNPVVEDPIVASVPGPDEIAAGYRLSDVDKQPPADPNKAVLEGLSGADRDAWTTALMGDGPEVTLLLPGDESVSMNSTGCLADALTAVYGSVESAMAIRHARRQVTGDAAMSSLLDNPTYMSKVDQ
ncbi:hypothetical protein [Kribbia dieselivorans]|uniref:hypothetical protein n=1 Tax=Kribbia dieselivorans TaxID=331526 RepID=UPI0012EDC8EA|nr:hypothetical protein [Kribbia dieselivorans]